MNLLHIKKCQSQMYRRPISYEIESIRFDHECIRLNINHVHGAL